jgi:hypothetical protein
MSDDDPSSKRNFVGVAVAGCGLWLVFCGVIHKLAYVTACPSLSVQTQGRLRVVNPYATCDFGGWFSSWLYLVPVAVAVAFCVGVPVFWALSHLVRAAYVHRMVPGKVVSDFAERLEQLCVDEYLIIMDAEIASLNSENALLGVVRIRLWFVYLVLGSFVDVVIGDLRAGVRSMLGKQGV